MCVKWSDKYLSKSDVTYYVASLFSESAARYLAPKLEAAHLKLTSNSMDSLDVIEEIKGIITNIEVVLNNVSHEKEHNNTYLMRLFKECLI